MITARCSSDPSCNEIGRRRSMSEMGGRRAFIAGGAARRLWVR